MDSYYGYETALWYWRLAAPRGSAARHITRSADPRAYVHTDAQELQRRPSWLDSDMLSFSKGIVHPLVFHSNNRPSNCSCQWHLWNTVPRDSFSPAGENSFVATPEFCFLQMAMELSFHELVMLGMELCGFYCLDPAEPEGFGKRRVALTNCARIQAFLDDNKGFRGWRAAAAALRYIADGAASPMESAIYLLLTLPHKRGGYCLPHPELNCSIDLEGDAMTLSGGHRRWGDLCWPEAKLDLEYLGGQSHSSVPKMMEDRRRTLAIEEAGYEVVEITKEQVLDLVAFDIVARRVAKKLGKRLYKDKRGVTLERKTLAAVLFAKAVEPGNVDGVESVYVASDDDEGKVFGQRA